MIEHGFDLVRIASIGLSENRAMLESNLYWVRRSAHSDPWIMLWTRINGVGSARRVLVWGH